MYADSRDGATIPGAEKKISCAFFTPLMGWGRMDKKAQYIVVCIEMATSYGS
jgi:hypothetical protein